MIYEARINLRNKTKEELIMFVEEGLQTIQKYEAELEKKDKVINEMAKMLVEVPINPSDTPATAAAKAEIYKDLEILKNTLINYISEKIESGE